MPGNGKNGKEKKEVSEPKEKRTASHTETTVEDRASGQQGLASSAATHASYGQSMVKCRLKAVIQKELQARNQLAENAEAAKHNENCYHKYHQQQAQKRNIRLEIFGRGKALAVGHSCFSDSKNLQELWRCGRHAPPHSPTGDSTDYDTDRDEQMKQVLAQMPALLPMHTLKQVGPATSGAGKQPPPPLPPMPPPTTSGTSAKLLRQALHTPPASEANEPLSPSVQSLLDTHTVLQQEEKRKWKRTERPLTALPSMALPKAGAGPCTPAQMKVGDTGRH